MAGHQVESNVLSKLTASRRLVPSREQTHNEGKGAKYTASRRPVRMVYAEEHSSAVNAIAREHQLKRWSQRKKEALIDADQAALTSLGRRRTKSLPEFTWRDLLSRRS
jgi:putative endonuclease